MKPAERTHCPQGHPYDEQNTKLLRSGSRRCRECSRQQIREWKSKKWASDPEWRAKQTVYRREWRPARKAQQLGGAEGDAHSPQGGRKVTQPPGSSE